MGEKMEYPGKQGVIGLLLSGPLGLAAVESEFISMAIDSGFEVRVAVGDTPRMKENYQSLIIEKLRSLGIAPSDEKEVAEQAGCIVCVGWRSLTKIDDPISDVFVIHDSLLPNLRGWNPLVTAVELGLETTGVTLFQASNAPDTGPIVLQEPFTLGVGVPIFRALEMAGHATATLLMGFLKAIVAGAITLTPQDDSRASTSPWRNSKDYVLDWNASSLSVQQFVLSRGFPYQGAKTTANGIPISIGWAKRREDFPPMAISSPGKTIFVAHGKPVVACRTGFVEIGDLRDEKGKTYELISLRTRFGT